MPRLRLSFPSAFFCQGLSPQLHYCDDWVLVSSPASSCVAIQGAYISGQHSAQKAGSLWPTVGCSLRNTLTLLMLLRAELLAYPLLDPLQWPQVPLTEEQVHAITASSEDDWPVATQTTGWQFVYRSASTHHD